MANESSCRCKFSSGGGLGSMGELGGVLALFMSYTKWHSFWYALGHFFLGWWYVVFYISKYGFPHIPTN